MGNIKYNNISSEELGIIIQNSPTYIYPERDSETVHVPGRNGDLVIDNKCFKNVNRSYNCAIVYENENEYIINSNKVNDWLHSAKTDYAKLEDSYDSEVYRLARYSESNSTTNIYDRALVFNINFECKPQRFLKLGDVPVVFNNNIATIENPSIYDALPLIKISGIELDPNNILLMSTIDSNNNVISTITLKSEDNEIYIDSETQNCYNENNEDINYKIGLNNKDFPVLSEGTTTINVESYEQNSFIIDQYTSVVSDNQTICKSEYKPQDLLVAETEEKIFIKSYSSIISAYQKTFVGSAYQSFVTEATEKGIYYELNESHVRAGTYTFTSINSILDSIAMQFSVYGSLSENPDLSGTGNGYIRGEEVDNVISIYATKKGYFMTSVDKYIRLYDVNEKIGDVKTSSSLNINFYDIDSNDDIKIDYDDLPEWLKFEIEYGEIESRKFPNKVYYKTNKAGTYWMDKKTLFGKPTWTYFTTDQVLAELKWSNTKRAFMPTQGITTSTTKSYTFRYLANTLQYSEIVSEDTYINVVRPSQLPSGSDDLKQIKLVTDRAGYYCYMLNDNTSTKTNWRFYNDANLDLATINGTDSFQIFYLESIPNYSQEEGWPNWLDPNVVAEDPLNARYVKFKVLENALYRYTYMEDSVEKYTNWVEYDVDDVIEFTGHLKTSEESFHISMIHSIPETYENDRAYTVDSGTPTDECPEWLSVDIQEISDENPNGLITYTSNRNGYFKWDTNSAWMKKISGETLLSTGFKDDTIIYFMESLPDYPVTYDLVDIIVTEDSTGNPNNIELIIKVSGYYRVNYDSDWTYYNVGDTLYDATVSEEIKINYLSETNNNSLDSLEISITPRWWLL